MQIFSARPPFPPRKACPKLWAIEKPVLCSVGLEFRDYPTLMEAVEGLDCEVIIAAASPWSKRDDSTAGQDIPANVTVRRFSQYELRELYAVSQFVIMPLYNVNFQAGITTILEAMAMEKAIVCSRTPGQTDVIQAGETGLYVTPEDPKMLRAAIEQLLDNPEEARTLGQAGRHLLEQEMSLTKYVETLDLSRPASQDALSDQYITMTTNTGTPSPTQITAVIATRNRGDSAVVTVESIFGEYASRFSAAGHRPE